MKKLFLLLHLAAAMTMVLGGCSTPDYSIVGQGETVYIEVEGETVYEEVEVPVYIEVEVPGDTEYGEIWVDSFTQYATVDGVDILWIIDTSGSMYRYDDELMAGIEVMLGALPESGWRLAMLSNDPAQASIEAQFPLVPGDDIDDATDMLNAMGTGGREEGFDAAYEYITNNSYASTWMRNDAALLVVFVSDEEEQSDQHMIDVSDFTTWYGGLRGGSAFVSSIVNVDPADSICLSPPVTYNVGYRYMEATNYFSGTIVDICDSDWSAGVTEASNSIDPYEYLELTHVATNEETMRVFINGALNWEWYYQSSDNTVYFTVIPASHDHVEIAYHYDPGDGDTGIDTGDTGF